MSRHGGISNETHDRAAGRQQTSQYAIFAYGAAAHDVDIAGTVRNPLRRAELQGLPILKQYIGPIWMSAGCVRYAARMVFQFVDGRARMAPRGDAA